MIKICQIISGDLWAGAEVMCFQLIKGLMKYNDINISVIILNRGTLFNKIKKLGIDVYLIDETNGNLLTVLSKVNKALSNQKSDVIHSHRYKENIMAYLLGKLTGKRILLATQHGMPEFHVGKTKLSSNVILKLNFLIMKRYFDQVVAVSNNIKNIFTNNMGFDKNKTEVIHNGITINPTSKIKSNKPLFVIGSAGRLFAIKDYPLMINIAKIIREKTNHVRFQLAGDGPQYSELHQMVFNNGLDDIFELTGHLDDMSSFYQGLDLYINTSIHEGIPMSVLEAMSYGLPIIAPDVGGFSEIIEDGITGYLVKSRIPEDFSNKCLLLFNDDEFRAKMAHSAREKVINSFSVDSMAEKYHDLYLSLAESI
jgi:L-malate glycosyltransferase